METLARAPYQGVFNIIRFNWHFYVLAAVAVLILLLLATRVEGLILWPCIVMATAIVTSTFISLFVSYYVYDVSGLYNFNWLNLLKSNSARRIINIHAGFDETSSILKRNFPEVSFTVFDFYDSSRHTEVSIERARKAYPAYNGTLKITTAKLPLEDSCIDIIFNIFALHEVRENNERVGFLKEQARALAKDGKIVIVEHLQDIPNLLAYNIGFFHFVSNQDWESNFKSAGLGIEDKFKITPFITVFILSKDDGATS